jgi:hypothetical protein
VFLRSHAFPVTEGTHSCFMCGVLTSTLASEATHSCYARARHTDRRTV